MHADAAELSDEHNRVAMILRGLITEGGASYVADFMRTEGEAGYYIAFNRSEYQRNFDRIDQAVTLLDALVQLAAGDPSADGNLIYRLGFSGYWDSPLYYVGYRMMQALESGRGRETLNRLVTEPPERLLLAFAALPPEQRSFTLSPRTVAAVQALADARASASRGSP